MTHDHIEPTHRLSRAMRAVGRRARAEGRRAITLQDLHAAMTGNAPGHWRWQRAIPPLDTDAQELWRRAEHEAALLGHPYRAPEHLQLVDASPEQRSSLIAALGIPFGRQRWCRPRGRHSLSRPGGRALIERRRTEYQNHQYLRDDS
jgi:hypothetical protein